MSDNVIDFRTGRTQRVLSSVANDQLPSTCGAPTTFDGSTLRAHLHPPSFFKLPFVTMPDKRDSWGEFWKDVDMWNDEPTGNDCEDYHRGKRYARAAVESTVNDDACSRCLEIVVERMIKRAFQRRGPKGALCRGLSHAEQGFITELCQIAVEASRPQ